MAIRKNLKVDDKRSLIVVKDLDKNLYLSSRNVPKSEVMVLSDLNTYAILKAKSLVLFESSIEELGKLLNA